MKRTKVYVSGKSTDINELEYIHKMQRAADMISILGFDPVTPISIGIQYFTHEEEAIKIRLSNLEKCDMIFMMSDWRMCDLSQKELQHFRELNKENKSFNILFEQENGYIKLSNYAQISQK